MDDAQASLFETELTPPATAKKSVPKKSTAKKSASKTAAAKPGGSRRRTAQEMAAKQREISVSEFFTKNRHLLGFDSPLKALMTTVKEAVDN